jgi:hypothetical protein
MNGRVRSIVSPALLDYLTTFDGVEVVGEPKPWDDDLLYVTLAVDFLEGDCGFQDVVIANNSIYFKGNAGGYDT